MYSRRSNLILGYHGLDESIGRRIIAGEEQLLPSENDYDWLGHGIYFWENSLVRAQQWAKKQSQRKDTSVKKPFAIGATIDLGNCLDLLDQQWLDYVGDAYTYMIEDLRSENKEIPENLPWNRDDIDFKSRKLDCAVILYAIQLAKEQGQPFDSVRAAFWEGEDLYPNAGFKQHNHIQISIINPECIRGIFLPKYDS
ncbi:hypothetical protein F974_01172 [Acinetobacter sp. CIP 102159]|uniref:hypothetical protein n=1 Tax=Acinetobacter sp. CIP 102159 TaxID=1144667 RepID=UPI0002D00A5C|nr:hypothetical protein [Acinetobacter sp. CIP 102159]ENU83821.1 hypothetical protein F974_01172 [Acinetobacter sp. CIP 102159]